MTPEEIKSWRIAQAMTQYEMGAALGVDAATVRRWEQKGIWSPLRASKVRKAMAAIAPVAPAKAVSKPAAAPVHPNYVHGLDAAIGQMIANPHAAASVQLPRVVPRTPVDQRTPEQIAEAKEAIERMNADPLASKWQND